MRDIILDLCSGTGAWSEPYRHAGYEVITVEAAEGQDVCLWPSVPSTSPRLPTEFPDIRDLRGRVRGVLAAPPCTVFAGSGARWPRSDEELREGLAVVSACLRIVYAVQPAWWALENPVGKLAKWLGPPRMSFNPCDYGDPWTKKTLLWGVFTTPIQQPVAPDPAGFPGWRKLGGRSERTKRLRSITPPGFAQAFFEANP